MVLEIPGEQRTKWINMTIPKLKIKDLKGQIHMTQSYAKESNPYEVSLYMVFMMLHITFTKMD